MDLAEHAPAMKIPRHTLRPFQRDALTALQSPGHVICVAATGSGKSLIYEKQAALPGQRTLLITPLIALARQQARRLEALGLNVSTGAGATAESQVWIWSPEKLTDPFQANLQKLRRWSPTFLVVDECHCVWEWGAGFRPAFSKLPEWVNLLDVPRSLWLTATLPTECRRDLKSRLPNPQHDVGDFSLPAGLHIKTLQVPWLDRSHALLRWTELNHEPGIIFTATRAGAERVARLLKASRSGVIVYHAGLSPEERQGLEALIEKGKADIVVATTAFGMGMDHARFRWVALWQAPTSLLTLTQMIGRVGRAGSKAKALLLWDWEDFRLLEWSQGEHAKKNADLPRLARFLSQPQKQSEILHEYFH